MRDVSIYKTNYLYIISPILYSWNPNILGRQQTALRGRAGSVIGILTSFGVHHEQIQHPNESMSVMNSLRGDRKPKIMQGCISVYREQSAIVPGTSGNRMGTVPETSAPVPECERPKMPGIRCRQCGEMFPVLDFHYTKKTGLCIPCWEAKVR